MNYWVQFDRLCESINVSFHSCSHEETAAKRCKHAESTSISSSSVAPGPTTPSSKTDAAVREHVAVPDNSGPSSKHDIPVDKTQMDTVDDSLEKALEKVIDEELGDPQTILDPDSIQVDDKLDQTNIAEAATIPGMPLTDDGQREHETPAEMIDTKGSVAHEPRSTAQTTGTLSSTTYTERETSLHYREMPSRSWGRI